MRRRRRWGQEQEDEDSVALPTLMLSSPREGASHTCCRSVPALHHGRRHVTPEQVM